MKKKSSQGNARSGCSCKLDKAERSRFVIDSEGLRDEKSLVDQDEWRKLHGRCLGDAKNQERWLDPEQIIEKYCTYVIRYFLKCSESIYGGLQH